MPQTVLSEFFDYGYYDMAGNDDAIYRDGPKAANALATFFNAGINEEPDDFGQPKWTLTSLSNMAILHSDDYTFGPESAGIFVNSTVDYSDEAPLRIRAETENIEERKHPLYQEIYRIYHEYSDPNWDGYDAIPVSENTFSQAQKFAKLLPDSVPLPDVMPEPTGEIAFEWYQDGTHVLVISVGNDDVLSYAGLFGIHCQTHGTERLTQHIPQSLLNHISRLFI